jgi:UPF0716 protein FxsA
MGYILFFIFIGIPIVEISVLISVGGVIGLGPTIAAILLTAFAGAWALRAQGLATLTRAQEHMQRGEFPITQVFDGFCLLVAGAFLLTPGFVTDGFGFLLFLPPFRALLRRVAQAVLIRRGTVHGFATYEDHDGTDESANPPDDPVGDVIDGEFEEIRPESERIDRK